MATPKRGFTALTANEKYQAAQQCLGYQLDEFRIGGNYTPLVRDGNHLYISGQIPRVGDVIVLPGKVGASLTAAPDLSPLILWSKGHRASGLTVGIVVGCLIGVPLRFYQGIEVSAIPGYWVSLPGMVVLAYGANALEQVLFRGYLQGYLEQHVAPLRAALASGVAFAACHAFLALSVTQLGWPVLLFTLIEGLACVLVRMR